MFQHPCAAGFLLTAFAGFWTLGWLVREPGMLQGLDYMRYYYFNADWLRRSPANYPGGIPMSSFGAHSLPIFTPDFSIHRRGYI